MLAGCGSSNPGGDDPPTYWADVKPILDARCAGCHVAGGIGGFALDDYAGAAEWSRPVQIVVLAESMPPWLASDDVAYAYDWSLTSEQIATIHAWVEAGVPEGDPADEGAALPYLGSELSRADLVVQMPEPYVPTVDGSDDYRCFPLEWPQDTSSFITGFNALPGNDELVHHVAAFLIDADNLLGDEVFEQLQAWDADEPDPGYSCFGGPSGPTGDLELPIQQIAQWVPGSQGLDFPEGTGIRVDPGAWIVLQIHYASPSTTLDDASDQTSIELRLDDNVERTAAFAPWLDALWALGNMEIPAGEVTSYTAEGDPRALFELLNPALDLDEGFTIHSVMVHMHQLGDRAEVRLIRADGTEVPLLDIPNWDFDWQLSYQLETPVEVVPGDNLSLTCTFDNPTDEPVTWGEGTDDEMCVANLFISHP